MKEIIRYIRFLLSAEGRVPLPGLGELSAHYVPAGADLAGHRFSPPTQRLHFGPVISDTDILPSFIASRSGKDLASARNEVERFCSSIRAALVAGETYVLPGIGTLYTGSDGNIAFEAETGSYTHGEGLGLQVFTMEPVPLKIKEVVPETVAEPVVETSPEHGSRLWIVWVVLFFATLVAAGWYYAIQYDLPGRFLARYLPENSSVIPVEDFQKPMAATDTVVMKERMDTISTDTMKAALADGLETDSAVGLSQPPALHANYHIIAGAFRSAQGVRQTIDKLADRGYAALVIDTTSTGLMVVSYGGYANAEEAEAMLKKIRAEGDSDAWIRKASKY